MMPSLEQVDPEIWRVIRAEADRQQNNLELIASENVVSRAVLEAQGWNITRAARVLDVDRVTLYNKIRKYGLQRPDEP